MAYQSLEEIRQVCCEREIPFWRAVLLDDMNERTVSEEESFQTMEAMWDAMLRSSDSYDEKLVSSSGLVGMMGGQMEKYRKEGDTLCGDFVSRVIVQALQMGESNACMKRIVAAPTAGACGVIPAVLVPLYRKGGQREDCAQPVCDGGNWTGYRIPRLYRRCCRGMPGRGGDGFFYGGRRPRLPERRG